MSQFRVRKLLAYLIPNITQNNGQILKGWWRRLLFVSAASCHDGWLLLELD